MSHALLVIDVQESFRHTPGWSDAEAAPYLAHQNRLIAAARAAGHAVVRVYHVDGDAAFSRASGLVRPLEGSDPHADFVVEKSVHSALMVPALTDWLASRGIGHLLISGIRAERCCETTARHGCDLGYTVDFISEATHTTAHVHPNGTPYSANEIKARTELALHGRFATVRSVDEAYAMAA